MARGGYAVIAITGVHDGDYLKSPPAKQRVFGDQLANTFGQLDYQLYVRGLLNKAKVEINHEDNTGNLATGPSGPDVDD